MDPDEEEQGLGALLHGTATAEELAADERRAAAGTPGGHMPSTAGELRRDLGDALTGALHSTGIDTAGAHLAQFADTGGWTGDTFARLLRQGDTEAREAERRSPSASGSGGGVGEVLPYAIGTGEARPVVAAAEAAVPLARAAAAVPSLVSRAIAAGGRALRAGIVPGGETAAYSGLTSRAPTSEGAAEDTLLGYLLGHGIGTTAATIGEGVSSMTSAESRRLAHRAADRQRVASVRGESRSPIGHHDWDELIGSLGGGGRGRDERMTRAAQAIRDSGIVGPFSSASEIADRATRAEARAGERMDAIRMEADAAGGSVPAEAVPRALEDYAAGLDPMGLGRWADAPREEARVWRDAMTPGERGAEMRRHPQFGPDTSSRDQARATLAEILGEDLPPIPAAEEWSRVSPGPGSQPIPGVEDMNDTELRALREQLVDRLNAEAYAPREAPAAQASDPAAATVSPARARSSPPRSVDPRRSASARSAHEMPMADADLRARLDWAERMNAAGDTLREAEYAPASALGLTIPRQRAEDALRILDRTTQWVTPSGQTLAPDTQVARQMRHSVRDTIDDALAPYLTPERAAEYPAARREYSVARTIGDVVRPAEERQAGRSALASGMQAAGPIIASGGGAAPAVAAGLGYRFVRGRGATTDATLREALARALDAAPGSIARIRPMLDRALRGGTLTAAHHLVTAPTEAERVIGESRADSPIEAQSGRRFRRVAPAAPRAPTDEPAVVAPSGRRFRRAGAR